MRKKYIIIVGCFIIAALISSCNKELILHSDTSQSPGLIPMTFTASGETGDENRSIFDNKNVSWEKGDRIAVFDNISNTPMLFTADASGATTTFSGLITEDATEYFAVYPYEAAVSYDWTTNQAELLLPTIQKAVKNGVDPNAMVCVAATGGSNLIFRNTIGLLKFTIGEDNVTAVTISTSSSRSMSGSFKLIQKTDGKGFSSYGDGTGSRFKRVVVRNDDESPFEKGETYYAAVRYVTSSSTSSTQNKYDNFSLSFLSNDAKEATISANNLNVIRNQIVNFGTLSNLVFSDVASTYQYLRYQCGWDIDICEKTFNWETDGDGILISSSDNFKTSILDQTAPVFIEPLMTPISNGYEINITKDVAWTSASASQNAVVKPNNKTINIQSGSLTCSRLDFDFNLNTGNQSLTSKNSNNDVSQVRFDHCNFSHIGRYLYASSTYKVIENEKEVTYSYPGAVTSFYFSNCSFGIKFEDSGAQAPALIAIQSIHPYPEKYEEVKLVHNLIYHEPSTHSNGQLFNNFPAVTSDLSGRTWKMTIVLNKNIIYNLSTNSSALRNYKSASVTMTDNLIVCPNFTPENGQKLYSQRIQTAGHGTQVVASGNYAYDGSGNTNNNNWIVGDNALTQDINVTKKLEMLSETPFTTENSTTGTFVLKSEYSSYGPQL